MLEKLFHKAFELLRKGVIVIFLLPVFSLSAQEIVSGTYSQSLNIAYDAKTKMISGYYWSCTGYDELTKDCRFMCSFYLFGQLDEKEAKLTTYFPGRKADDSIAGNLKCMDLEQVKIKLSDEHGGCANVQHFADSAVLFELSKPAAWTQIRWVQKEFAYFYSAPNADKKKKTFLRKEELVYIDKQKGKWVHVVPFEKQQLGGWLRLQDLNSDF